MGPRGEAASPSGKRTRHSLGQACESHRPAELVTAALQTLAFEVPDALFHSDQGKQLGAEPTRPLPLEKGFQPLMSRAGPSTDNGSAQRCVGVFKLAVAEGCRSQTLGEFLRAAQGWVRFDNSLRPHESLAYQSPDHQAQEHSLPVAPSITLL